MFVDASAIVAILTEEAEAQVLAKALEAAPEPITSPISIWEAAASISRRLAGVPMQNCQAFLLLDAARVSIASVDAAIVAAAVAAFDRYGRRSGHRAELSMGDCFAYAFAKQNDVVLLFRGNDFSLTDVRQTKPRRAIWFDNGAAGFVAS